MSRAVSPIYRMGSIEIDPSRASILKAGEELRVRPKSLAVLNHLLANRNRIVAKEELFETVWEGTTVTEDALTQCISDLRKNLGDDPRHPQYIRTIPKQGFMFIGAVEEIP